MLLCLLKKRYMMNDLHLATPTIIIECYHGSIYVQQNKNNKTGGGGQKGSVFFGVCRLLFDLWPPSYLLLVLPDSHSGLTQTKKVECSAWNTKPEMSKHFRPKQAECFPSSTPLMIQRTAPPSLPQITTDQLIHPSTIRGSTHFIIWRIDRWIMIIIYEAKTELKESRAPLIIPLKQYCDK